MHGIERQIQLTGLEIHFQYFSRTIAESGSRAKHPSFSWALKSVVDDTYIAVEMWTWKSSGGGGVRLGME